MASAVDTPSGSRAPIPTPGMLVMIISCPDPVRRPALPAGCSRATGTLRQEAPSASCNRGRNFQAVLLLHELPGFIVRELFAVQEQAMDPAQLAVRIEQHIIHLKETFDKNIDGLLHRLRRECMLALILCVFL